MLSILLEYLLKKDDKPLWHTIVRSSFFLFNGVLAGVLMNDIIRLLFADFEQKPLVEYTISGATAMSGYMFNLPLFQNKQNNLFLGTGMMIGTFWANLTEEHKPISLIPSSLGHN